MFDTVSGKVEPFPEIEDESEPDDQEEEETDEPTVCAFRGGDSLDVCCAGMMAGPVTVFTAGLVAGYVLAVFLKRL